MFPLAIPATLSKKFKCYCGLSLITRFLKYMRKKQAPETGGDALGRRGQRRHNTGLTRHWSMEQGVADLPAFFMR